MTRLLNTCFIFSGLWLSACVAEEAKPIEKKLAPAAQSVPKPAPSSEPNTGFDLPAIFDCLREEGGVAIAAHRGGPYPGYPENAIETMQFGYDRGVRVFEIDVAESRDGTLYLMHDRSITRTTNGSGAVADVDWADVRAKNLVDNDGLETNFKAPTLREALDWAIETGAVLELDKKPTTSFRNIISEVRAANAENYVIMISYDDQQAGQIARIAPDLMMTASAFGDRDIGKLEDLGVVRSRLIAWTGTRDPNFAAWDRVIAEGVEPAFGTLGRPGERLDDEYLADGEGSEFEELAQQGLVLLATDTPLEAAAAMSGDEIASDRCGL